MFQVLVGTGVQAVKEEEHSNSTVPTGAVEKRKHSSTQHVCVQRSSARLSVQDSSAAPMGACFAWHGVREATTIRKWIVF